MKQPPVTNQNPTSDLTVEQAKAIGFKAVEFDLRMTKDQQLVIFHDHSAKHLCLHWQL